MRIISTRPGAIVQGAFFGAAILAFAANGFAEEGPHEHGVARLNLAIEGRALEIELIAPGADIVGFEHAPTTPDQKAAVKDAVARLKAGADLFAPPKDARCALEKAKVESSLIEDDEDHDHEHEHEKKEHEKHDDHHGHDDEEAHAEFRAHYHFECAEPAALIHLETRFFKTFPAAREIEARWITPKGQGAAELTASNPRMKF